jgi:hypothetical protein
VTNPVWVQRVGVLALDFLAGFQSQESMPISRFETEFLVSWVPYFDFILSLFVFSCDNPSRRRQQAVDPTMIVPLAGTDRVKSQSGSCAPAVPSDLKNECFHTIGKFF